MVLGGLLFCEEREKSIGIGAIPGSPCLHKDQKGEGSLWGCLGKSSFFFFFHDPFSFLFFLYFSFSHLLPKAQTQVVSDVEQFPGHIACSSASKSEIVVPVIRNDEVGLDF